MTALQTWRPRESRTTTWVKARVANESRSGICAVITNVSNCGCRLKAKEPFEVGEVVRLFVPGLGAVSAKIRWSGDGQAGAEFIAGSDSWATAGARRRSGDGEEAC